MFAILTKAETTGLYETGHAFSFSSAKVYAEGGFNQTPGAGPELRSQLNGNSSGDDSNEIALYNSTFKGH
jgi:hypothetical protein